MTRIKMINNCKTLQIIDNHFVPILVILVIMVILFPAYPIILSLCLCGDFVPIYYSRTSIGSHVCATGPI